MYNVIDYGCIGDGVVNDTFNLQKTIDECHLNGGGRVVIPENTIILTSTFYLKDNVELYLENNSRIKGMGEYEDYIQLGDLAGEYKYERYALIYAKDSDNIKISGTGVIDGNGMSFVNEDTRYIYKLAGEPRVTLMYLENCNNLKITDITIENCSYWTIHPAGCNGVLINNIKILQDLKMPNCDGIDPDHCKNVLITNCQIESADDCIVLKNTKQNEKYGDTENIIVSNCNLKSTSAAIKIGTESHGNFKNINCNNLNIFDSNRGIAIQIRDYGSVENVFFSNININTRKFDDIWWGKGEPIYLTIYPRDKNVINGELKNIRFEKINITSENAIFISGVTNKIKNVTLDSINHEIEQKSKWNSHVYDKRPINGQEHDGLFEGELVYCYIENVQAMKINEYNTGDKYDKYNFINVTER